MHESENHRRHSVSSHNKRIAILANSNISFGGGERILGMIINELREYGNEIYLYSYSDQWRKEQNRFNKLRILKEIPVIGHKYKSFRELRRVLREDHPECLICFSLAFGETSVLACRSVGIPFLTTERCDPSRLPVPGKETLRRLLRLFTYRLADGIVFQTPQVRDYFPKSISRHSRIIPNPVIDDSLPEPNKNPEKIIVSAGRLSAEKRYDILIDAFASIPDKHGYILKIYGQGPLKAELDNQIKRLGLQGSVKLMGQADKMVERLVEADIFVLSSDHEGMPNALIEGMAMGLACVSTDFASGGASRLIRNGENGLLVPTEDTQALAEAISSLINNTHLKDRLRREAPKIRITNSKEKIIPQWINYIDCLIDSARK